MTTYRKDPTVLTQLFRMTVHAVGPNKVSIYLCAHWFSSVGWEGIGCALCKLVGVFIIKKLQHFRLSNHRAQAIHCGPIGIPNIFHHESIERYFHVTPKQKFECNQPHSNIIQHRPTQSSSNFVGNGQ